MKAFNKKILDIKTDLNIRENAIKMGSGLMCNSA